MGRYVWDKINFLCKWHCVDNNELVLFNIFYDKLYYFFLGLSYILFLYTHFQHLVILGRSVNNRYYIIFNEKKKKKKKNLFQIKKLWHK